MEVIELPKPGVMRAALRATTDRLAAELATPGTAAPDWRPFEWRTAMAVSAMHGISGLLAGRLSWCGPPEWQAFLAEQQAHGLERERRTRALLSRLDAAARSAGLPFVALKGSALLDLGVYAAGERPMSDVDLLVRQADFERAHAEILKLGFVEGISSWKHRDYQPLHAPSQCGFGEHAANPIKIELHVALPERLPVREIDIAADVFPPAARPGLNAYPGQAALMRHLLLHAAGNLCEYAVRLIHLHDIAVLAPRLSELDWEEALAPATDGLPAWWAAPPFALAQRLFPVLMASTPRAMQLCVSACPRPLRIAMNRYDLHGASASRFSIPMLPGLEWTHSSAEAWACASKRLRPQKDAEAVTRRQVQGLPALAGSAWTHRPRWRKALSFLHGAPPRVQTLYSLHRALAYRPSSSA